MSSRAPNVDYEVRWGIVKLADLVLRGVEETPPKVTIHLPPTPVLEQPPPIKLPPKVTARPIKTGGPSMRSPLVSTPAPPKLKIVPSGSQARAPPATTPTSRTPGTARMPPPPLPAAKAKPKPKPRPPTANGVKPPQIPKAQTSGMSLNDLRACRNALKKLKLHKSAILFMQPVDPVRDHAPK